MQHVTFFSGAHGPPSRVGETRPPEKKSLPNASLAGVALSVNHQARCGPFEKGVLDKPWFKQEVGPTQAKQLFFDNSCVNHGLNTGLGQPKPSTALDNSRLQAQPKPNTALDNSCLHHGLNKGLAQPKPNHTLDNSCLNKGLKKGLAQPKANNGFRHLFQPC